MYGAITARIESWPAPARAAAVVALVGVLTFAAYSGSFDAWFHLDDNHQIVTNPYLSDLSNVYKFFTQKGVNSSAPDRDFYRPLTTATFAVNYVIGGQNVTGYHVVNFILHVLNALMVFALVRVVLARTGREGSGGVALFASLAFALHPVQTAAVTYISARAVLLATFFSLTAFYAFVRYRDGSGVARAAWGVAAPLMFLAGMFSKEMTVCTVGVMLCYDLVVGRHAGRRGYGFWLYYASFAAGACALVYARHMIGIHTDDLGPQYTALNYLMSETKVVVMYMRLLLAPYGQNADYFLPVTTTPDAGVVMSSAAIMLSLAGLYRLRKEYPAESFFGLFFFVALIPESSVFPIHDIAVEYRVYLPSVGFLSLAALVGARVLRRAPAFRLAACVLIVLLMAGLTFNRNRAYSTELSYWSDTARKAPYSFRAAVSLGMCLVQVERYADAVPVFERALGMDSPLKVPHKLHNLLGKCYLAMGDTEKARYNYEQAVAGNPGFDEPYLDLGKIYYASGEYAKAREAFSTLTRLTTGNSEAEFNLAITLMVEGDLGGAITHMELARAYAPDSFETGYNLALMYEAAGRMGDAAREASRAAGLASGADDKADADALVSRLGNAGH